MNNVTTHRRTRGSTIVAGVAIAVAVLVGSTAISAFLPRAVAADDRDRVSHHEFQAQCAVSKVGPNDPIVFPGKPGASHDHTFMGNTTTDAFTTTESLLEGDTSCTVPADKSAYWFPSLFKNDERILPIGNQTIYYKSGIEDYTKVVPFPQGLQFIAGSMMATKEEFRTAPGAVEGFECQNLSKEWDIPQYCDNGSQLNIRYQAPSCWDGVHLSPPASGPSHMVYPVMTDLPGGNDGLACPSDHPVAVPMLEFKMAFPVSGDMSELRFASGRGYSWHYDFFNAWDPQTLAALVKHCINGGLQCNPSGYDQYKPWRGSALDENLKPQV